MKKEIWIIGTGTGQEQLLTKEACAAVKRAQLIMGAGRLLEAFSEIIRGRRTEAEYRPKETAEIIRLAAEERIGILVSGDSGFFSAAKALLKELKEYQPRVLPGISSLSFFAARTGISWEDAAVLSLHGTDGSLLPAVKANRKLFVLASDHMQPYFAELMEASLPGVELWAGENLGGSGERISHGSVGEMAEKNYSPLTVFFFLNSGPEERYRTGLDDSEFIRGDVPMTKREIRALSVLSLRIRPDDVLYDIGAGTGSVSVEMALCAERGAVYAVECVSEGITLIEANRKKFGLHNLKTVCGTAPEILEDLPVPDAAFIGGSRGRLKEIVEFLLQRNPGIRITVNAIAQETAAEALEIMETRGMDPQIIQVNVARGKKAGRLHMMTAQNPVSVISGQGKGVRNGR